MDDFVAQYQGDKSPHHIPMGRNDFAYILARNGLNKGVEVGVERGVFSEALCKANPFIELYCVDPWLAYKGYREHVSQDKLDGFYIETAQKLKQFNVRLIRKTSTEAAKDFKDGSLDFVYIDANHDFFSVVDDIRAWEPKVRSGGVFWGHDFRRFSGKYTNHVKDVIPAYAYAKKLVWYVLDDQTTAPSWLWIKP
jgi:hypothetical protein